MNFLKLHVGWTMVSLLLVRQMTAAVEPVNPDLIPEARKLLNYFDATRGKAVVAGISSYNGGPGTILDICGYEPALFGFDASGSHPEAPEQNDALVRATMNRVLWWWRERGGIVAMQYHWVLLSEKEVTIKQPEDTAADIHIDVGRMGLETSSEQPGGGEIIMTKQETSFFGSKHDMDVGKAVQPGTPENQRIMADLKRTADLLSILASNRVPVLWRPLHEIDGGWFWWTDLEHPEHTAELWRLIYTYFVKERKLNNLIWVWNLAHGSHYFKDKDLTPEQKIAYRKRYYPGDAYVDIASIDTYGWGTKGIVGGGSYDLAYELVETIAPGKMIAMAENAGLPNPETLSTNPVPWIYAMAWFGTGVRNPPWWVKRTYPHAHMLTLDELPDLTGCNAAPTIRITSPVEGAGLEGAKLTIEGVARDRDKNLDKVELRLIRGPWKNWYLYSESSIAEALSTSKLVGKTRAGPDGRWRCTVTDLKPGPVTIVAVAFDKAGLRARSNVCRLLVNMKDLARGKPMEVSAKSLHPEWAVDGDPFTMWELERPRRRAAQHITVDLGKVYRIDRLMIHWWKAYPRDYEVRFSKDGKAWETVKEVRRRNVTNGDSDMVKLDLTKRGRYVRIHCISPGTFWGGYAIFDLCVFEAPHQSEAEEMADVLEYEMQKELDNNLGF